MKFKGLIQIVQFNKHFYLGALTLIFLLLAKIPVWEGLIDFLAKVALFTLVYFVISSMLVSWYIFDYKKIQNLAYLINFDLNNEGDILNIHAGFDETSERLNILFSSGKITILDFYQEDQHTEKSLQVARKMGANKAASEKITTAHIPRPNESVDYIFLIFSAHEIRNTKERNAFFQELKRVLKKDGKIIMTEHLCDMANFLAYGPGVFHFWTEKTWLKCLEQTGMSVKKKLKITPWISSFLIGKS